ncbi:MAG TPA: SUMF1/EgtB/PvdO family nonheme iron enzyme, partial [Candidatus Brocadiaceae bacterium]|nr:SUMF1/EgtB/PvdO family nonheme iron enzyme [Candidatus Brocadiaceae bacterium]
IDGERCNSGESGNEGTTRVTMYPNGISPYGCYDMAGNVWEWTNSLYAEAKDMCFVRGGSWDYAGDICRCANRGRFDPFVRRRDLGFRCARTL